MSVKYRKVKNNRKGSKTQGKIYGKAVVDGVIHTKEIAEKISKRCTLTEPDIIAVINALETEIAYGLADSKRIVLDGFGSFKVGIKTTPADSPKKFGNGNIVGMHVNFLPAIEMYMNKRMKSMLRSVKVEEMTEYNGLEDEEDDNSGNGGGGNSGNGGGGNSGGTGNGTGDKNPGSSGTEGGGSNTEGGNTEGGGSGSDDGHVNL